MRSCICLWVTNEDLSKTFLSSDRSFLFHDTFNFKALPPKEAWLFSFSLSTSLEKYSWQICSCPFPLSPHPFGGVFGSSGELLLLENSVAGNGGSDEGWERGGVGHGTPPCA